MISKTSKYAIRALIELANADDLQFTLIDDLARKTEAPSAYMAKLAKQLVRQGFLVGKKGRGGGVRISQLGREASFYDVCAATKDHIITEACFLSHRACSAKSACPFHNSWSAAKGSVITYLKQSKISGKPNLKF